jgi:sugar lactone lactonase YvrE
MSASKKLLLAMANADTFESIPWDITNATYNHTLSKYDFSTQEGNANGIFFKSDGTKMYLVGETTDDVNEYDLSSAWNVSTASHNQTLFFRDEGKEGKAIFFKPDGTKMYIVVALAGRVSGSADSVLEYDLSTTWDISTASYSTIKSVATEEINPQGIFFSSDGTKMYITGAGGDEVNQYALSTAWDVSSASASSVKDISTVVINSQDMCFSSDGSKMYFVCSSTDAIHQYNLSTAWNSSSASYSSSFSCIKETNPKGITFNDDGTLVYLVGAIHDIVYQFSLSTAWDISTAYFAGPSTDYLDVCSDTDQPKDIFFKSDGTKMYVIASTDKEILEYDLSTAWDIGTASYSTVLDISAETTAPNGIFFKSDGTKMYTTGTNPDYIHQYSLSTAWDVSTANHQNYIDITATETAPQGIFFKPDGTQLYFIGAGSDSVHSRPLSTAWDITSAGSTTSFSVSAQTGVPRDVDFKSDGTKMYVLSDAVTYEYDLSTAWDVSSASYSQSVNTSSTSTQFLGMYFKSDGTKLFYVNNATDEIFGFDV